MDQSTEVTPHQCIGIRGSYKFIGSVPSHRSKQTCSSQIRQCDNCSVHQPSGRDKVAASVSAYTQTSPLVYRQEHCSVGDSYSGSGEHSSRQSVSRSVASSNRMATLSDGRDTDLQPNMDANNRPVCVSQKSSTAGLLLKVRGRSGVRSRRHVHQLARDVRVRVSADIIDPSGPSKDVGGGVYDSSRRPLLAKAGLVSDDPRPVSRTSEAVASDTRSPQNARVAGQIPRRREPAFSCVAAIKRRYANAGLSQQAAELVVRGRRSATLKIYNSRLRPYVKWCTDQQIDPYHTSVAQVAEFLRLRFETGLQASTIRGYLSAILLIHISTPSGESLKNNDILRLLIEGMHNVAPPIRRVWPAWDLNNVLDALNKHPFEPMLSSSLRDAALKTAFLIAIASGKRASEIHALAVGNRIVFSRQGATLYFRPKFLAKNERSSFKATPISLPKLGESAGSRRLSCPVRCLKWYISKTQSLRGDIDHLFITSTKPYRPAAKVTISGWIVEAIIRSKAVVGQGKPNAHSTRSVASSCALFKGLSVVDIINTISWKTDHVFIKTYLKDQPQTAQSTFASAVLLPTSL